MDAEQDKADLEFDAKSEPGVVPEELEAELKAALAAVAVAMRKVAALGDSKTSVGACHLEAYAADGEFDYAFRALRMPRVLLHGVVGSA